MTESRPLFVIGILAVALAVLANLAVYFVLGAFIDYPPDFASLQPGSISLLTTLGVAAAVIVFALIRRRSAQPARTFTIVAIVAFVLSIIPNILLSLNPDAAPIPGAVSEGFLILIVFLVVATIVTVYILTRWGAASSR